MISWLPFTWIVLFILNKLRPSFSVLCFSTSNFYGQFLIQNQSLTVYCIYNANLLLYSFAFNPISTFKYVSLLNIQHSKGLCETSITCGRQMTARVEDRKGHFIVFRPLHHHHFGLFRVLRRERSWGISYGYIDFITPCHFLRSHASSSITCILFDHLFFISYSISFFYHVCFGRILPLLLSTSTSKSFAITFLYSFSKHDRSTAFYLLYSQFIQRFLYTNKSINSSEFLSAMT